jgi:hypothetical protein
VRGGRVEQSRDHLDVPQPGPAGVEHLGGGGQPGRQLGAVNSDARADVFGGVHPAAGLEPLPAEQISQPGGGGLVAAVGERSAPLQRGDGGQGEPVQASGQAFAHVERRQQLGLGGGTGLRGRGQRVDRLDRRRCAVATGLSVTPSILLELMFEY